MTSDALVCLGGVFTTIWRLFTSWYIPGTNGVTPAMAFLFVLAAAIGLRFALRVLGLSPDIDGGISAARSVSDSIVSRRSNSRS